MTVAAPPARTTLALAAAVGTGALIAVQQRINGELGERLDDVVLAALVSFLAGLLPVAVFVLSRPRARAALTRVRDAPRWSRVGGVCGASLVAVGAAATPVLGVALLTVGLVAGQTTGGLLVDKVGLGPGGPRAVTLPRIAGAALCLGAAALTATGREARAAQPLLLAVVFVAGAAVAVQQGLNGRVRATTGDAGVATLVNFGTGTAALALLALVASVRAGLPAHGWPGAGEWYLYLGGPIGAMFVATAALTVRLLGVLRLGLAGVSGQLVGAVALDAVLPATGRTVSAQVVVGAALTLVAVAVAGLGQRP